MKKSKIKNSHTTPWYDYIPIILAISFVPLIIRLYVHNYPLTGYLEKVLETQVSDVFSYYKSIFIIISGIMASILLIWQVFIKKQRLRNSIIYYPILGYSLFVVLSWIFSKYTYTATMGYIDRYEGSLVLLSYMFLLIYSFNFIRANEKQVKIIIYALLMSACLLCFIGFSQLLGTDLLSTEFFQQYIMIPNNLKKYVTNINFTFTKNEIYQTLTNINYVGSYICLVIPLPIILFFNSKKRKFKLMHLIIYCMLLINLLGSKSSGGLYGFILIMVFFTVYKFKLLKNQWLSTLIILIVTLIIVLGFKNSKLFSISDEMSKGLDVTNQRNTKLQGIIIKDKDLIITYDDNTLKISILEEDNSLVTNFYLNNQELKLFKDNDKIGFENKLLLENIYIQNNNNEFILFIDDIPWNFIVSAEGFRFSPYDDVISDITPAPSIGFQNKEYFGNSRGYIWSRTFPLLKNNFIIGSGADTYIYQFPHNDYVKKYLSGFEVYSLIDKPHNMFLGIAINTGILSLLCLLLLFVLYFVQSIVYLKRYATESSLYYLGLSIFLGIIGYLSTGLVNDSVVSVAPVFWTLLGIGFGCNHVLKKTHVTFNQL